MRRGFAGKVGFDFSVGTLTAGFLIALGVLAGPCVATPKTKPMPLDGSVVEFKQSTFPSSLENLTFFGRSKVNFTQPVSITVRAPIGAVVSVFGVQTKTKTPRLGSLFPIAVKQRGSDKLSEKTILRKASSMQAAATVSESDVICCGRTKQMLDSLLPIYSLINPGCDYQCICDIISKGPACLGGGGEGGNGGDGTNPLPGGDEGVDADKYATVTIDGAFQKDSCRTGNTPWRLVVSFDLRKVDRNALKNGIAVKVAAREITYGGSRAASIKPVSDGKYAPRPLLLMARTGAFNEAARVVRWSKGKPRVEKVYEKLDSAFYQGLSLVRTPVELPGGFATVELLDIKGFSRGYGVCLEMTRRRQYVNGYPISPREGRGEE